MKKYILIFILTLLSSCSKEELEIKTPTKNRIDSLIRKSNEGEPIKKVKKKHKKNIRKMKPKKNLII